MGVSLLTRLTCQFLFKVAQILAVPEESTASRVSLLPDPGEMNDDLDRLLHVLNRHPFEPRVEVLLAGKDVGCRQPHERQPASVGAAANRPLAYGQPTPSDRFARMFHDVGV